MGLKINFLIKLYNTVPQLYTTSYLMLATKTAVMVIKKTDYLSRIMLNHSQLSTHKPTHLIHIKGK